MKNVRIAIAVVLSVTLMFAARALKTGQSQEYSHTENGFTFAMTSLAQAGENDLVEIKLNVDGPMEPGLRVILRQSKVGQDSVSDISRFGNIPMRLSDSASGLYVSELRTGARGGRLFYYFDIRDGVGGLRARFTPSAGGTFLMRYTGTVPVMVLAGHLLSIATAIFCITMAALYAFQLLLGGTDVQQIARYIFWAAVAVFMGGYPFGIAMRWYFDGRLWEAVPFGTDVTDNKTQLLFVYILFVWLSLLKPFSRDRGGFDLLSPRTVGMLSVGAFAMMIVVYLVPHSTQYDPDLTKQVSYGFIAVVVSALTYLYARAWQKKTAVRNDH